VSLLVETAGLLTLIEGAPRRGLRHLGVPASGAADPLSLALANRLVGNALDAAGLEVSLAGAAFRALDVVHVAVTGAGCAVSLDGRPAAMHRRLAVEPGVTLRIGPAETGARSYVAIAGAVAATHALGSPSTYLPARLGGYSGRALQAGDIVSVAGDPVGAGGVETPEPFRLRFRGTATLRIITSSEFSLLVGDAADALFRRRFRVGGRNDRMGVALDGPALLTHSAGRLDSEPVFPGTLQCPESGQPFLLGVDAQTTGGYPRVADVIRADRFQIGQLRTGGTLRFLQRDPITAAKELEAVHAFWSEWMPGIEAVI
jgi:allophanate hydrolase